jgi:hypothetical protein
MRREFNENTVRYLEMIQTVVTRMGTNAFSIKTLTVTLVAGILALTSTVLDHKYVSISLIPVLVCIARFRFAEKRDGVLSNSTGA